MLDVIQSIEIDPKVSAKAQQLFRTKGVGQGAKRVLASELCWIMGVDTCPGVLDVEA